MFSQYQQKQPPEVFYKKGVRKNFVNLQENTCARVSFLIKRPATFLKRDSDAGVFL